MFSTLPRTACFRFLTALGTFLLLTTITPALHAEQVSTEEWNISADRVIRYEDPSSIVARGNVVLEKKEKQPLTPPKRETALTEWSELLEEESEPVEIVADNVTEGKEPQYRTTITIRADWMAYDVELQSIKAKGNLEITTDEDRLFAKAAVINLTNETGKFTDATILREEHSLHLEGKSIEKTGFETYRITDGWVITCKLEDGQTPPWSFSSSQVDVKPGGYALLKHAKFNIKNIPVFYTPYMVVPVKNTRQTGFLFPEFSSSSNNGFGFNLPFFWNISESTDLTFYPEYLQNRGFMPGLDFRYVSSASDKGALSASYLDDKLSDPSEIDYYSDTGYTHDNSDRYWVRGKADHTFAEWQTRLDLDIVSDQDYLNEFDFGVTGFDQSQDRYVDVFGRGFQNQTETRRENTLKFLRSWDGMSLEADLLAINDSDTRATDINTPLWKLPGIDFTGAVPIWTTNFTFDWDAEYVNYWREDGIGGHRLDLIPTISAPVPLGPYLESRAEVFLRDTFYVVETYGDAEWQNDDTQNRLLPGLDAEVATTLERDFFRGDGKTRNFKHQMRPFINYIYVHEDDDQDELPDFDDVDFISEENRIVYGIDNFFNAFSTSGDSRETTRDYGFLKLTQSYDLRSEASDEPFSDISARLNWKPTTRTSIVYETLYDVYDSDFNRHLFESTFNNSRGDSFSLDYSFKDSEDIDQINAEILAHIVRGWVLGGMIEHSISQDETVRARGSLTYQALCGSVKFETRYTPEDTTYLIVFNLANIGVPLGIDF
ncbi:MAG: LPS-assembly protein LptD [Desulforhopalus sp.]